MKITRRTIIQSISAGFFFLLSKPLFADKTSVEIEVPATVKKGTRVTIKIKVTHKGNNMFHYTDWVVVKIDGQEAARWEYSMFSLPEKEVFTKELKYTFSKSSEIEAQANCNIHGSAGKRIEKVFIK